MISSELYERSLKIAPGGVHSPVRAFKGVGRCPIFFKSAEKAYLESVEGDRFIDFCMSFGPLLLGHRDPEVSARVQEMIGTAWTFGACEPYSLELAEWVCAKLPHIDKIRFVSSGTEAVMSALRVARAATGRHKILKFDGCYHGHTDSMLVKAGSGLAGVAASDSAGVSEQVASETLVAPLDNEEAVKKIFNEFGESIAAIIIEPLPANFGLLEQRSEFLNFLAKTARANGSLLIFDEVISGFRVAFGGMAERTGIEPDLVTYGKVLGGGFNVAAYAGKSQYLDLVAPNGPVYQAGTLSANPVGMVAGLATLKAAVERDIYQKLENRAQAFVSDLNQEIGTYGFEFSQMASLIWLHPKTDKPIRSVTELPPGMAESYASLFENLLKQGVYFAPSAYEVGFLSAAHDDQVLEQASDLIKKAFKETYA